MTHTHPKQKTKKPPKAGGAVRGSGNPRENCRGDTHLTFPPGVSEDPGFGA